MKAVEMEQAITGYVYNPKASEAGKGGQRMSSGAIYGLLLPSEKTGICSSWTTP